jgi:hypothetical protein
VFAVVEADFEKGVGLFIDDYTFCGDQVFCCQSVSPWGVGFELETITYPPPNT